MNRKRILCLILCIAMVFGMVSPARAIIPGEDSLLPDLADSMDIAQKAVPKIAEVAKKAEDASAFAKAFNEFASVAQKASSILGVINGSVVFLRLIGVLEDPNAKRFADIMSQLQSMDEKIDEMNGKLNNITDKLSQMQASAELNTRTEKAILLESNWRDFGYRYMEEGLDALIDRYDAMMLNGLTEWCAGGSGRTGGSVDNSRLILLYQKTDKGYELICSDKNTVPADLTAQDAYVVLESDFLPRQVEWDANDYNSRIYNALLESISAALNAGLQPECQNKSGITKGISQADLEQLASDALQTLIYRISADRVNRDAGFAKEVVRVFGNYCSHLTAADDGIDAVLKTMFLTHSFESEISEELTDFCNRMIVKTACYGLFVADVLGASNTTTDSEKTTAMIHLSDSMHYLQNALDNSLTGRRYYSYVTNSELYLNDLTFEAEMKLYTTEINSNQKKTFESCSAPTITPVQTVTMNEGAHMIGDTDMLVLTGLMSGNGIAVNFENLKSMTNGAFSHDYGKIVTDHGAMSTYTISTGIKLKSFGLIGDYFGYGDVITRLPGSASGDYAVRRSKIAGSVYDLETGALTSGQVLFAVVGYGESHWYWITDEAAMMAGPTDAPFFNAGVSTTHSGNSVTYTLTASAHYNTIMDVPLMPELKAQSGYDPIASYKQLLAELSDAEKETSLPEDEKIGIPILWIVCPAAALLIAAAVALVMLKRKKTN